MCKKRKRIKEKQQETPVIEQNEYFAFIAGYTPAGFPYGITWEEQAEIDRHDKQREEEKKSRPGTSDQVPDDEEFDLPF